MDRRWRILAALTVARASMGFQFQSVAAASPFVSDALGLDKSQFGWLIGLYLLPGVVIALPGGLLGARFGDKRLVLVGLLLMGAGGLWFALAGSFPAASAARLLGGTGAVMMNVLMTKMVADWFDGRERLFAMSVLVNAWPIGIGLALLVVGPIGQRFGWPEAMASTAVFAAIGFALVLTTYRAPPGAPPASAPGLGLGVLSAREWRLLALGTLPWLLFNAAFQIALSFLPPYFVEAGRGIAGSGSLVATLTALSVLSVQTGGVLLRRAGRPDLLCHLAIAGWCAALLALAAAVAPLPWIVLGGLLVGLPAAAYVSLPAEILRPASRAAGMGVFYVLYYAGCAVLPALAGRLYDAYGGRAALWLAAGLALAIVPIHALFRRQAAALTSAGRPPAS